MNVISPILDCSAPLSDYATAFTQIQQMHNELNALRDQNAQLRADLHREQDRVTMVLEELTRWRDDALKHRARNTEYETILSNIFLMTTQAQENLRAGNDLPPSNTPVTEALKALDETFKQGNAEA
jgi:predicted RNase H-like nuclease (RuvC/YqgF family)